MSLLAELIRQKKVSVIFMVHSLFENGRGLEFFFKEMTALGIDVSKLVEGEHYVLNDSDATIEYKAGALRKGKERPKGYGSYSAEVWIKGPITLELIQEVALLLAERDSHPSFNRNGDIHIWNNPLARECVLLGAWTDANFLPFCGFAVPDSSIDRGWVLTIIDDAKIILKRLEIQEVKNEAFAERKRANVMKKTVFKEHAREYNKAATKLEAKLRELEFGLAEMVRVQQSDAPSDSPKAARAS